PISALPTPPHLTQMSGTLQWWPMTPATIIHCKEVDMGKMLTIAAVVLVIATTNPSNSPAQSDPGEGRETLTRALRAAGLPLESGLAASAREGTPLSAKYEIDAGAFQLSVYTRKVDAYAGDSFSEVIVDYNTSRAAKSDTMTAR